MFPVPRAAHAVAVPPGAFITYVSHCSSSFDNGGGGAPPPPIVSLLFLRGLVVALNAVACKREILEQRLAFLVVKIQLDAHDLVEQDIAFVLDEFLHVRTVGEEGVESVEVLALRVLRQLLRGGFADVDEDCEAVALPDLDGELLPFVADVLLDDHLPDGGSIVT